MRPIIIRDLRQKEKFQIDDAYLNGYARLVKPAATAVYMSLCRHADKEQKSFPSVELLAKEHGITVKTAQRAIQTLKEFNIIHYERTRSTKGKWLNNTYFLQDKSVWVSTGQKRPMEKPQDIFIKTTGQKRPTKDIHIKKDTHISIIIYDKIENITEKDLAEIAFSYRVSLGFVKLQLEKLTNYCEATGKTYKNYRSALRNFVLKDMQREIERPHKGGIVDGTNL